MLNHDEILEFIARESDAFAATIHDDTLANPVPGCPDWNLSELVAHLGEVQRAWAAGVRRDDGEPGDAAAAMTATDADGVRQWFRDSTAELLDALRDIVWDRAAWTWWGEPRTVGAIARHQAQEAGVHRWDAQSALARPEALAVPLADDSVDEFLDILRRLDRADSLPGAVAVRAIDSGSRWVIGPGEPGASISGSASDLLLHFYGRLPESAVAVDGDHALVDVLRASISTG